jgi:hypothetical protein
MSGDNSNSAGAGGTFASRAAPLLALGLSVIPVQPGAKDTIVGARARTRDPEQVAAWAENGFADANAGICADTNFTLLESDNVAGFTEKVRELTGKDIPRTLCFTSGRSNRCCWIFRRTPGCGETNPFIPGLFEFRNHNMYAVGPGSIHPLGLIYSWADDTPPVDFPDWLVEAIHRLYQDDKPQREVTSAVSGERIPTGQRHAFLVGHGGSLLAKGTSLVGLEAEFLHVNRNLFAEPESEDVIRRQAHDMFRRWHDEPHVVIVNDPAGEKAEQVLTGVGRRLSDIQPRAVAWLWEPYVPQGAITILTGDPGAGKSYIALAVASRMSLLGRGTIYLTVENSPEYTLRPRFDSLGGDPSRIFLLEGVDTGDGEVRGVQLQDVAIIERVISEQQARFVVIDPIQSYLGAHIDAHRANETRPALDGLVRLAERTGATLLIVRHASKNGSGRAIYKGQGSIDFTAAARSELMAGETQDHRRALVHIKSNLGPFGPAQGYEIGSTNPAGTVVTAGYFRWTGECEIGSADLMEAEKRDSARDEARDFLKALLASGPRLALECAEEADQAGFSKATLRRAKSDLRVRSYQLTIPGPWSWALPVAKVLKFEKLSTWGHPQHTNPTTTTNLVPCAPGAQDFSLEHLGEHLAAPGQDRKTPPSSPAGLSNSTTTTTSARPVMEPGGGGRWELEDEEEEGV